MSSLGDLSSLKEELPLLPPFGAPCHVSSFYVRFLLALAIFEAAFLALANLCNNEQNQTSVGASHACRLAVHACARSANGAVIRAAARCASALAFGSFVNKTRLGEFGALEALLGVLKRMGFGPLPHAEAHAEPVEWAGKALASLLLHQGNRMRFRELWGLQVTH